MAGMLKTYLRFTSWPIIAAMISLMAVGVAAIHVSEEADPSIAGFTQRQMAYAAVALIAFVVATVIPYARLARLGYPIFGATLALLVLVFFTTPIKGSHRWIDLGVTLLQPSELAKIAFIILLAAHLRYGDNYRRLRGLVVPFILTFVPMALILKEPDLGTSLLFLPTLYMMLFMAGAKLRHLLGIMAVATVLLVVPVPKKVDASMTAEEAANRKALAYFQFDSGGQKYLVMPASMAMMEQHQISRVVGWWNQNDPQMIRGNAYQLHQAITILGAGKFTGSGDWADADNCLRMLPEDHTDFIFSVVGGQWGFAGCVAVLFLYGVIFLFGIEIAVITYDPFGRMLAVGVLALLFSQIIINVGMALGMMPVTGMTLPMVSYGGSSLVVNCAALGLLVNVGQRRPILLSPRPFEHDD
jgi:rod shape-determining protein RodA